MYCNSSGPRLMLPAAASEKEMSEVVIASSPRLACPVTYFPDRATESPC